MSPLSVTLIHRKANFITQDLDKLQPLAKLSSEEYYRDYINQLSTERLLEKIIGRLIDINFHILKEKFNDLPKDYYDSFMKIAEHGVVDARLAKDLAPASATRNILAHEYDAVDPDQIFNAAHLAVKLIPQYLQEIMDKLEK